MSREEKDRQCREARVSLEALYHQETEAARLNSLGGYVGAIKMKTKRFGVERRKCAIDERGILVMLSEPSTRIITAFRPIKNEEQFDRVTQFVAALANDYREVLDSLTGPDRQGYSLPFLYGEVLISKAIFERAVAGMQSTFLFCPLIQKLDGRWHEFAVKREQLTQQLREFLSACRQDRELRRKTKVAAEEAEQSIDFANYRQSYQALKRKNVNSADVTMAVCALDDLRLFLDERRNLRLQELLGLKRNGEELEKNFREILKLHQKHLGILSEFHRTLREHRQGFLILDDKKYPWWYPEKRKAKTRPELQAEAV